MMKRFLTIFLVLTLLFSLLLTSCATRKRFGSSGDDDDEPKKSAKKDSEETETETGETETKETETEETETKDPPVTRANPVLQEPEVRSDTEDFEGLFLLVNVRKNGDSAERYLYYWSSDDYDFILEEDDQATETEYYWFVSGDTVEKGISSFGPDAPIEPVTGVSQDQLVSEVNEIWQIITVFILPDDLVDAASFEKLPDTATEFGPAYVYNVLDGSPEGAGTITVDRDTGLVVKYVYSGLTYEILDWDFYED